MTVQYWPPLEQALARTRRLLFSPFDLGRWFVLGFTAWLIYLGRVGGSAAGNDAEFRTRIEDGDLSGAFEAFGDHAGDLFPSGLAAALILFLVALAVVVAIVLLWVGCRARFVWLDNLTGSHHRLSEPWTRLGRLGDSFFLWKIAFTVIVMLLLVPLVVFGGLVGALTGHGLDGPATFLGWVSLGIGVFVVAVATGYVDFFGESFVTVIMHRRGVGVLEAWSEFRRYFEASPGHFLLVGVVKLLLQIAGGLVILILGLVTCCVGWFLVSLPYLGAVVQLPLFAALRYYDLCWLGQIDPDLALPDPSVPEPETPQLPEGDDGRASADAPTPDSDPTP